MEGTITELKTALLKCANENIDKTTLTGHVVVSSVCKASVEAIDFLLKELENEKKLNEEIKVRFVKCNTCTEEMKSKCLMFNENLCEGERCEELVDLMALVTDSSDKAKITQGKEIIRKCLQFMPSGYNDMGNTDMIWEIRNEAERYLEED